MAEAGLLDLSEEVGEWGELAKERKPSSGGAAAAPAAEAGAWWTRLNHNNAAARCRINSRLCTTIAICTAKMYFT